MRKRTENTLIFFMLVLLISQSCGGQGKNGAKDRVVGGCTLDTLSIGVSFSTEEVPSSAAWIRIGSLENAGEEVYREAVSLVRAAADSAGIHIFSCSELVHIESGTCWPPYTITLRVKAKKKEELDRLRTFLANRPIGDLTPYMAGESGYGTVFITSGRYAIDWWSIRYGRRSGG